MRVACALKEPISNILGEQFAGVIVSIYVPVAVLFIIEALSFVGHGICALSHSI